MPRFTLARDEDGSIIRNSKDSPIWLSNGKPMQMSGANGCPSKGKKNGTAWAQAYFRERLVLENRIGALSVMIEFANRSGEPGILTLAGASLMELLEHYHKQAVKIEEVENKFHIIAEVVVLCEATFGAGSRQYQMARLILMEMLELSCSKAVRDAALPDAPEAAALASGETQSPPEASPDPSRADRLRDRTL